MKKDEILNASRKEHRNKDLAEMEVVYQAGSHASRNGFGKYASFAQQAKDIGSKGKVHFWAFFVRCYK